MLEVNPPPNRAGYEISLEALETPPGPHDLFRWNVLRESAGCWLSYRVVLLTSSTALQVSDFLGCCMGWFRDASCSL